MPTPDVQLPDVTENVAADYKDMLREVTRPRLKVSGSGLLMVIVSFAAVAILWASIAEVDEVTRGQGKVVPSQKVQVLQSYEGGIVEKILVQEGESVTKGQVLLELEQTLRQSEYDQTRQQYYGHLATSFRLKAEMNGTPLEFPTDLTVAAPAVVASETMLFQSRREELSAEVRVLDSQLFQRRQELAEARLTLTTTARGLALANDESVIIRPLVERGLEPKLSLLQLERTINDLSGKGGVAQIAVERLTAGVREIEDKRNGLVEHYRAAALAELSAATSKVAELNAAMSGVKDRLDRTEMKSPVTGVVNRLYIKHVGAIAQAGSPLIEVVPTGDTLRVEGYIKPADIAFLHTGQAVKVKISAYDYSRYGSLEGTLVTIGADAIEMPNTHEMMYPVQIDTSGQLLDAESKPLDIKPGMVADVDILSGKKTVMAYLIRPITKVKSQAFRE